MVNYTRTYASTRYSNNLLWDGTLVLMWLAIRYFRNFFELVRFDFILTEELKVWLMEVRL